MCSKIEFIKQIEINKVYVEIPRLNYDNCEFPALLFENTTYQIFFDEFMIKNLPCVLKNICLDWECSKKWVKDHQINCDYLISEYGNLVAPVADCNNITYNAQCKTDMSIESYIQYLTGDNRERILYLKDWHLRKLRPEDSFYKTPFLFAADWLNEFAQDTNNDDFMFVYIGPQNSWTPLHSDVYNSYSWSVNIVGKKKWIFFPPGEENKLKDSLGNMPLLLEPDAYRNIQHFEIIQDMGDAVFVPSGWYHQVLNLEDTISVNHNWVNGCNIENVWNFLQCNLLSVEHEIEEHKNTDDYSEQCQLILKSVFGMDYTSFFRLLCHIGNKRLNQLQEKPSLISFENYTLGTNYVIFDLHIILKVLNDFCNLSPNKYIASNVYQDLQNTKKKIIDYLK